MYYFTGKVDFLHELEKDKEPYDNFMNAYSKLKRLWNLFHRSGTVHDTVKEICNSSLKTPGITRWNSEFDAMNDAYEKRYNVSFFHNILFLLYS